MIPIKPVSVVDCPCPKCHSSVTMEGGLFYQGMHVLADCTCHRCGFEFYHTLPIGHDLLFPIQLSKDGNENFYHPSAKDWLALPLIRSFRQPVQKSFQIRKHPTKTFDKVVIVNCLDSCFGHVFSKIWNCHTLIKNQPDLGVIAIVPERCMWLLPTEMAEVWAVSIDLKDCAGTVGGLDEFVKSQLGRYQQVFLSHTYTHLDHTRYVDMEKVLKTPRFALEQFSTTAPHITFVLREDRFWLASPLMNLLFMASRKLKVEHWGYPLFSWRQRQLVNLTGRKILNSLPNAQLVCTGLGKAGKLDSPIADHRTTRILAETEVQWNALYAKSHMVIGVHGSHMLIPSALAAGFINIVPRFKIQHLVEDTVLPYTNRLLQFMGRFLDEFASPHLVSAHAISMIRDFDYVYRNLEQEPE